MTNASTTDEQLTFPHPLLRVRPLADPVLDSLGHDPRSAYVEQYWLSVLGPSAILLVRRLANGIEAQPEGFELNPVEWAQELGLGAKGGRNGPFWRSIDRICRFGAAQRNDDLLAVRRRLPPLTRRQIERLPDHLRRAHDRWSRHRLATPRRKTISQWADRHELGSGDRSVGAIALQDGGQGFGQDGKVDDE
ncbi:MAG: hypothetical protein ACR2QO_00525 [Acidimicrobiales bacterium]